MRTRSASQRLGQVAVATALTLAAAAPLGLPVAASASPAPPPATTWTYLAMGDSNVYGPAEMCGDCTTYPLLLEDQIPSSTGVELRLLNASQWNKLTASKLLDEIRSDNWGGAAASNPWTRLPDAQPSPRAAIAQADLITIQVGFNDLPWLAWVDPCNQVYDHVCRDKVIPQFAADLDAVLTEVDRLRAGKPTAVRVANVFNDVITGGYDNSTFYDPAVLDQGLTGVRTFVTQMSARTCAIARRHHAECLDLYRLFNGPDGTSPVAPGVFSPEFGDMNQLGQDMIAAEVQGMGWKPLRTRGHL